MDILIDTHILLWSTLQNEKLSKKHRMLIEDPDNDIFISIVSLWEIAIKESINKVRVPNGFWDEVLHIYKILYIELDHIKEYVKLPFIHRDPFDRMLVAQSRVDRLKVISTDVDLAKYDIECL